MPVIWPSLWQSALIIFAFVPVILAARYQGNLELFITPFNDHYAHGTLQHYTNDLTYALRSHHPSYDSAFAQAHSGQFPVSANRIEEVLREKGDKRHIVFLKPIENPLKGFAVAFPVSHPGEIARAKPFAVASVYPHPQGNGAYVHVHGLSEVLYTPHVEHYLEHSAPASRLMPGAAFSTAELVEELRWLA